MISPRTILALVGVSFRCCLSTWMQSEKPQNDLCSFPRQTIQYQVIQVCAPTSNAEEAEVEQFYEDLQDLLELTHPKDVLFIIWDRNAKVRSPDTWSNRQIWCWSTEWSRAKANRVLPREHTGHSNTLYQQNKRRLYTWTSPDGQYQNQIDYILCQPKMEKLYTDSKKQDPELTVAQIMNSLLPNSDWNWKK